MRMPFGFAGWLDANINDVFNKFAIVEGRHVIGINIDCAYVVLDKGWGA